MSLTCSGGLVVLPSPNKLCCREHTCTLLGYWDCMLTEHIRRNSSSIRRFYLCNYNKYFPRLTLEWSGNCSSPSTESSRVTFFIASKNGIASTSPCPLGGASEPVGRSFCAVAPQCPRVIYATVKSFVRSDHKKSWNSASSVENQTPHTRFAVDLTRVYDTIYNMSRHVKMLQRTFRSIRQIACVRFDLKQCTTHQFLHPSQYPVRFLLQQPIHVWRTVCWCWRTFV